MTIDIKDMIYIIVGLIGIIGAIVGFFVMQSEQNNKIKQLQKDLNALGEKQDKDSEALLLKQDKATNSQIETDKTLSVILTKLDRLLIDMEELKKAGCGRCSDKT